MKLFHATWPSRLEDIMCDGLQHGTYFAGHPGHAAAFMALKPGELVGFKDIVIDGVTHTIPDVIVHDECVVLAVDTAKLFGPALRRSYDHAADQFPDDLECWQYRLLVPPEHIQPLYRLNIREAIGR